MRFVVGLGNPGERYRRTRHNAGFMVVDSLAARSEGVAGERQAGAWVAQTHLGSEPVLLVKPQSFMNLSGEPVARLLEIHEGTPADLVVVVDDVALDLGTIRVRVRGGDGGHNGLGSLIQALGTADFARVRVGVRQGELPEDLAAYVLADFPPGDEKVVEEVIDRAAAATSCLVTEGAAVAMSRFNGRRD
jgi:PTH1 family peptidyl-tRNA hydrolase